MTNKLNMIDDATNFWLNKITCSNCSGIVDVSLSLTCPICNFSYPKTQNIEINGFEKEISISFAGAIPRTTYLLFTLMREEWNRPINRDLFENQKLKTSPRAMFVILFWIQFESLIDQLLSFGMKNIPKRISDHLLKRHQHIGSRIEILYPLIFETSFKFDLEKIGYPHLVDFLNMVQEKRNSFIHGNPEIIDDDLVIETVKNLRDVQEAWIKLYNLKFANIKTIN